MILPSIGEKGMLGYNKLLKDTCVYERFDTLNKYNEKVYGIPKQIKCFVSFNQSNSLGITQQNVSVSKVVFIDNEFEPHPFDRVDGLEIKQITPVKGLVSPIVGWEIAL